MSSSNAEPILVEEFPAARPSLRLSVVTETWPPEINGVALTLSQPENQRRLVEYLSTRHALRDPRGPGRSCDIFPAQFDQVLDAHRAAWNRFPNPMFEIEHILTGCVAVAMAMPTGGELVLRQARDNLIARSKGTGASVN